MPEKAGATRPYLKTYYGVRNQVHQLYYYWHTWKELYKKKRTIAILNKSAPLFFMYSEKCFLVWIMLCLTRLLDPSDYRGNKRLSLTKLIEEMVEETGMKKDEGDKLLKKYDALKTIAGPLKKDRDHFIAHTDSARVIEGSRHFNSCNKDIRKSLSALRRLYAAIEKCVLKNNPNAQRYDYNADIQAREDVGQLIRTLKNGVAVNGSGSGDRP